MKLLSLLITPPSETSMDGNMVRRFMDRPGRKVVCGGSTSRMVEAFLGTETDIDLSYASGEYPPGGTLPGIDLVTEGGFTLARVLEFLTRRTDGSGFPDPEDPARTMAGLCAEADTVEIFFGSAAPGNPAGMPDKKELVGRLAGVLEVRGKRVTVYNY